MKTDPVDLVIMRGLPGSGKTYTVRKMMQARNTWKRISKDVLREMLDFGQYSRENESIVIQLRDLVLDELLSYGHPVIVDDTNLDPKHEERLRHVAKKAYPNVNITLLDLTHEPVELCIERDATRANPVGAEVIRAMAEKYLSEDEVDA